MNQEHQSVIISQAVYDEIIEHAREGKPEEVCGVLRGRGRMAIEAVRGENVAEDRVNNYEVDPQTLLQQFKFEETGEEMMGIYHSHPVSAAYPSATDAWSAHYPDAVYFICSLEFDEAPVLRAFRLITHFVDTEATPVDLVRLRGALRFQEIRPQSRVFAYYQSPEEPVPAVLAPLAKSIDPPFYVEYKKEDENGNSSLDLRVIALTEHPIQIVE